MFNTAYSIKLCKDILSQKRQSSFFLRMFKYYHNVILTSISFIDSGLPSGTFASIQQSKLTGKWVKVALIDCVNSILALPSSLPVCTIIEAAMNNLSMFNDVIGLFSDKGAFK